MKQFFYLLFLSMTLILFSKDIPVPDNNYLYTDFTFERTSPFLKKPVTGSGRIVMDGKDNFIFKQIKPVLIIIKKIAGEISFQKGDAKPIIINAMSDDMDNGNIAILFSGDSARISELFKVTYSAIHGKDNFELIPRDDTGSLKTILLIHIISNIDKIEKIKIEYKNKSTITYSFFNAITGIKPDEKNY